MEITAEKFIESLASSNRVLLLGGLAVIAHGLERMTRDVDIWLDPTADAQAWSVSLNETLAKTPTAQPYDLAAKQPVTADTIPEVVAQYGVIRIIGLDRPIDVFREPNNLETGDFNKAWEHASISLGNVRVMDAIDILLTKEGTRRAQDIADMSFLERKIHMHLERILPCCGYAEAKTIFDRYADAQTCALALGNPDRKIRALATETLDNLARDGDLHASEILRGRDKT